MRLYLAGPMTGLPRFNFDAFASATSQLRAAGFEVWSPHERDLALGFDPELGLTEQGFDLRAALEADLEAVLDADLVALLPGWERSPGVLIELTVASARGIPWREVRELLNS